MVTRAAGIALEGTRASAGLIASCFSASCQLVALSAVQVQTWRDSLPMWEHCLRVDADNALAQGGLADNLVKVGRFDEAIQHYRIALRLDPDSDPQTLKNFAARRPLARRKGCFATMTRPFVWRGGPVSWPRVRTLPPSWSWRRSMPKGGGLSWWFP